MVDECMCARTELRPPTASWCLSLSAWRPMALFNRWVSSCPLETRSGNALGKRDLLEKAEAIRRNRATRRDWQRVAVPSKTSRLDQALASYSTSSQLATNRQAWNAPDMFSLIRETIMQYVGIRDIIGRPEITKEVAEKNRTLGKGPRKARPPEKGMIRGGRTWFYKIPAGGAQPNLHHHQCNPEPSQSV